MKASALCLSEVNDLLSQYNLKQDPAAPSDPWAVDGQLQRGISVHSVHGCRS